MSVDDLARLLAAPMPRRRALKLLGAAALSAAMPLGRPRGAAAQEGVRCTDDAYCPSGTACCVTSSIQVQCCQPHEVCRDTPDDAYWKRSCQCANPCGGPDGMCCEDAGMQCVEGRCVEPCPQGTSRCGDSCCRRGERCVNGRCEKPCPSNRSRCGKRCCPKGQRCVDARRGRCKRCPPKREACGEKCCGKRSYCCDPDKGLCCPRKGGSCCPDRAGGGRMCCHSGKHCARPVHVSDDGASTGVDHKAPYMCCPTERRIERYDSCCPPGHVSLGGKLLVVAGGGGGMCCRKDKVCGDTCCATGRPYADQETTCCGDRCANLRHDSANCGACGNACPAGHRCQDGSCVPA